MPLGSWVFGPFEKHLPKSEAKVFSSMPVHGSVGGPASSSPRARAAPRWVGSPCRPAKGSIGAGCGLTTREAGTRACSLPSFAASAVARSFSATLSGSACSAADDRRHLGRDVGVVSVARDEDRLISLELVELGARLLPAARQQGQAEQHAEQREQSHGWTSVSPRPTSRKLMGLQKVQGTCCGVGASRGKLGVQASVFTGGQASNASCSPNGPSCELRLDPCAASPFSRP